MVNPLIPNGSFLPARQPSLVAQNQRFISVVSPTTNTLRGVWIETINNGAAVGDAGTILNFNGDTWTLDPNSGIVTVNQLNRVDVGTLGVIGPNVKGSWAVGNSGTLVYFDVSDNTWKIDGQSGVITAHNLYGVLIYDSNALVIAVGSAGVILTWDGTTWSVVASGVTTDLRGIGFDDNGNLWICGDNGVLLFSGDLGATWTLIPSGVSKNLIYVWFSPANDWGYVVGDDGIILKIVPSTNAVSVVPSGLSAGLGSRLWSFELTSETSGFIVGNAGNILSFDGNNFYIAPSPTSDSLVDVAGTAVNVVFAVGVNGDIWKLQSDIYATAIESRGVEITPLKEEPEQAQLFTNFAITDNTAHDSAIFDATRYKIITFYIANTLNQQITVQIKGNLTNSVTSAVNMGSSITVAASTGIGIKTVVPENDGWLPYVFAEVTASVAPISGSVNAYAIGRN